MNIRNGLKRIKQMIMTTVMTMAGVIGAEAGNIYVSEARGNNANDGTQERPLKTIDMALRQARELRRLQEVGEPINIILEGGVYRLRRPLFIRPEDSGTASSPTIIRSADGEKAVISGGTEVKGWTRGCDDARIAAGLRDKIWTADAPTVGNRIVYSRQLWVNGRKALLAKQFAAGVMERMIDFDAAGRTITIPTPSFATPDSSDLSSVRATARDASASVQATARVAPTLSTLEMTVHQRWAIAILRVKEMTDNGDGTTTVTFHEPESTLEFEHPWPQPVIGGERGNSSFFLANALELLDQPGEWYQDYPSGRIYYYPADDDDMTTAEAVMPVLETLVDVNGSRERTVGNISFENVSFQHAAWYTPSTEGHVTLQGGFPLIDAYKLAVPGLPEKAELENQAWITRPTSAVTVRFASAIDFIGCEFSRLGATGLDYVRAVNNSTVSGCLFTDIGGTAIEAGTFPDMGFETHVPYIPATDDEICAGLTIENNKIQDATNEDWGCVGIGAGYVSDIRILHNEVCDVNYSGICVGWGWTALESGMKNNVIRYNHVHDYAKQLYDAGGIYTLSNQPGSVISDNRISAPHDAPYATNRRGFCIYFDEATDGFTVERNETGDSVFGYNRPGPDLIVK